MGNGRSAILNPKQCRERCTRAELGLLYAEFNKHADTLDGISKKAFIRSFLESFSVDFPDAIARSFYSVFDFQDKQFVTLDEFICGLVVLAKGSVQEHYQFVFRMYDTERVGKASPLTILNTLRRLGVAEEEYQEVFNAFRAARFSTQTALSWEEIMPWFEKIPALWVWILRFCPKLLVSEAHHGDVDILSFMCSRYALAQSTYFTEEEIHHLEGFVKNLRFSHVRMQSSVLDAAVKPFVPIEVLQALTTTFDGNGSIDVRDYICGLSACCRGTVQDQARFFFHLYQPDQRGTLSKEQFVLFVRSLQRMAAAIDQEYPSFKTHIDQNAATMISTIAVSCEQFTRLIQSSELQTLISKLKMFAYARLAVLPQDFKEECALIKNCSGTTDLRLGDEWFVISKKWFDTWKSFVYYEDSGQTQPRQTAFHTQSDLRPGHISNEDLIDPNQRCRLRPGLVLGKHYTVLPAPVWSCLFHWYGSAVTLPRRVVRDVASGKLVIEYNPWLFNYRCKLKQKNSSSPVSGQIVFSCAGTIGALKSQICASIGIACEKVRLWRLSRGVSGRTEHALLSDDNKLVTDYDMMDNQELFVDVRLSDGSWPVRASSVSPREAEDNTHLTGLCGLSNLGNTCFMSSTLQCLSHSRQLTDYFLNHFYLAELKFNHSKASCSADQKMFAIEYARIVFKLWESPMFSSFAPNKFKYALGKYQEQFRGYQQHDAQELLQFVLSSLHESLNREHTELLPQPTLGPNSSISEKAQAHLASFHSKDRSVITDLFYFTVMSTLKCPSCRWSSVRFEPYNLLPVELPRKSNLFVQITLLSWDRLKTLYTIKCPLVGTVDSLLTEVSLLCRIPVSNLICADVYKSRIYSFLDNQKLAQLTDNVCLYVYEIPSSDVVPAFLSGISPRKSSMQTGSDSPSDMVNSPRGHHKLSLCSLSGDDNDNQPPNRTPYLSSPQLNATQDLFHVCLVHRVVGTSHSLLSNSSVKLFGTPFVLQLPRRVAVIGLYHLVWSRVSHLFSSNIQTPQFRLADPRLLPFTLSNVNRNGNSCYSCGWIKLCFGCSLGAFHEILDISDVYNIAIDWNQEFLSEYFDPLAEQAIIQHSSVTKHMQLKNSPIHLKDTFSSFFQAETLTFKCEKCLVNRPFSKQLFLWNCPPLLIVHLKRFSYDGSKIATFVDYPVQDLDLSVLIHNPDPSMTQQYDLYAVANHIGAPAFGHYTSSVCWKHDNKWYTLDDESCRETDAHGVVSAYAYLLFYVRKDVHNWSKEDLLSNMCLTDQERKLLMMFPGSELYKQAMSEAEAFIAENQKSACLIQ